MAKDRRLLPCPFCGGEAYMNKRGSRFGPICFVKCEVCGAQTRAKSIEESVESDDWNDAQMFTVESLWNNRFHEKE